MYAYSAFVSGTLHPNQELHLPSKGFHTFCSFLTKRDEPQKPSFILFHCFLLKRLYEISLSKRSFILSRHFSSKRMNSQPPSHLEYIPFEVYLLKGMNSPKNRGLTLSGYRPGHFQQTYFSFLSEKNTSLIIWYRRWVLNLLIWQ